MTDQSLRRVGEKNGHRHDQRQLCGVSGSHTFKHPHSANAPSAQPSSLPSIFTIFRRFNVGWLTSRGKESETTGVTRWGRGSQSVFLGCETDTKSPCKLTRRWSGFGQSPVIRSVVSSHYRDVEGSFLTRLWARNELSMGFSSGGGWEFFRAE